jgi:PAS domain S-box-containing protein
MIISTQFPFLITGLIIGGLIALALLLQRVSQVGLQRRIEKRERLLLRTLLDEVDDGIELVEVETLRFVEVNAAACRIMGWSREEYLQRRLTETQLPPESGGLDAAQLAEQVRARHAQPDDFPSTAFDHRHLARDGRVIDIRLRLRPLTLGQTRYVLAIWQDITEQKHTGQLLDIQQGYQNALLSHAPFRIWLKDRDGRYLAANLPQARGLGQTDPAALTGRTDAELCPRCAAHEVAVGISADDTVIRDGQPSVTEERFIDMEGRQHWLEVHRGVALNAQGQLLGTVGFALDITERRTIQAELQAYRDHLEDMVAHRTEELDRLFQALPDLYFRMGRDGTILDFRAGNVSELYVPPSSFLGRRMQDILPANVSVCFMDAFARIEAGGTMECIEYALDVPQGHQTFEARVMPFSTDQSVIVVRDITERRATELAREQALDEVERLGRIKTEFLANMSHEIRTPLNGVLGFAQIGLRSQTLEDSHDAFTRIIDSGQLLLGIINDILDFSKIDAGGLQVESVPLRLALLIRESIELVQDRAHHNRTSLHVRLDPALPPLCLGDPLRIRQILINLLSNAVKFTQGGQVRVRLLRDSSEEGWVRIEVEDSGIGMTAEQLGRIFRPFEQGDGSTTRRFGGTGLGLAITHRLVHLMGGSIAVESQPGRGSHFKVRLHCPAAEDLEDLDSLPDPLISPDMPPLNGLRLLVAEDNAINRQVLEQNLRADGAMVTLAIDGFRAVEQVRSNPAGFFHLVLMDVQMPELDGYDATRAIHAIDPELPVVGQTAHAMASDRERCLAAGMIDHLAKPIDPIELIRVVLRHARPRPDGPAPSPSMFFPLSSDGPQSNHSQGPAPDR